MHPKPDQEPFSTMIKETGVERKGVRFSAATHKPWQLGKVDMRTDQHGLAMAAVA